MKKRKRPAVNEDTLKTKIGQRIRNLRRDRDIQQGTLAINAGIDPATLNQIENGKRLPDVRTVLNLANQLDVPASLILDESRPAEQASQVRNAEQDPASPASADLQHTIQEASYQVLRDLFTTLGEALEARHEEAARGQATRTRTGTTNRHDRD